MTTRIHVVLAEVEKARYRSQAAREGKSLGAWLREAAEEKLLAAHGVRRLDQEGALQDFFAQCDAREVGREPDWEEHLRVMGASRGRDRADT
jgi:hypothetical protein